MIQITYSCNGCDAAATMAAESSYVGLGPMTQVCRPTIRSTAPEGWEPIDPYTGACYCPTCWSTIERHTP